MITVVIRRFHSQPDQQPNSGHLTGNQKSSGPEVLFWEGFAR
jgi:hypothetical protein